MTLHVARPRDLVQLAVLGLLCEQPRHPYDMLRTLRVRGNDAFVTGLPRSIYHAVEHLVAAGFAEAGRSEREGARPERTVYQATDEGRTEFRFRLQTLLSRPSDPATFHAALSLIGGLDAKDATWSLRSRLAALDGEVAQLDATYRGMLPQVPRLYLVEAEYLRAQLASEIAFVRGLVEDVEAGRLVWPDWQGPAAGPGGDEA